MLLKKKKFEKIAKSIFKETDFVQIGLSELWIRLGKVKKRMIRDLKELPCKGAVSKVGPFNKRKR